MWSVSSSPTHLLIPLCLTNHFLHCGANWKESVSFPRLFLKPILVWQIGAKQTFRSPRDNRAAWNVNLDTRTSIIGVVLLSMSLPGEPRSSEYVILCQMFHEHVEFDTQLSVKKLLQWAVSSDVHWVNRCKAYPHWFRALKMKSRITQIQK